VCRGELMVLGGPTNNRACIAPATSHQAPDGYHPTHPLMKPSGVRSRPRTSLKSRRPPIQIVGHQFS
jgi:hypothetical protein